MYTTAAASCQQASVPLQLDSAHSRAVTSGGCVGSINGSCDHCVTHSLHGTFAGMRVIKDMCMQTHTLELPEAVPAHVGKRFSQKRQRLQTSPTLGHGDL
jgi:hypothetical protein